MCLIGFDNSLCNIFLLLTKITHEQAPLQSTDISRNMVQIF